MHTRVCNFRAKARAMTSWPWWHDDLGVGGGEENISGHSHYCAINIYTRQERAKWRESTVSCIGCHRGVSLSFVLFLYRFVTNKQCILSMIDLRMFICSV